MPALPGGLKPSSKKPKDVSILQQDGSCTPPQVSNGPNVIIGNTQDSVPTTPAQSTGVANDETSLVINNPKTSDIEIKSPSSSKTNEVKINSPTLDVLIDSTQGSETTPLASRVNTTELGTTVPSVVEQFVHANVTDNSAKKPTGFIKKPQITSGSKRKPFLQG